MIIREFFRTRKDGVNLYRSFSDEGLTIIRNDGIEYDAAIDVEGAPYTYIESDRAIKDPDDPVENP